MGEFFTLSKATAASLVVGALTCSWAFADDTAQAEEAADCVAALTALSGIMSNAPIDPSDRAAYSAMVNEGNEFWIRRIIDLDVADDFNDRVQMPKHMAIMMQMFQARGDGSFPELFVELDSRREQCSARQAEIMAGDANAAEEGGL